MERGKLDPENGEPVPLPSPELVLWAPSCAEQQVVCSPICLVVRLEAEGQGNKVLSKDAKGGAGLPKKPMAELRFKPRSPDCKSTLDASHTPEYSWEISVNSPAREPDQGLPRCFASWPRYPHRAAV